MIPLFKFCIVDFSFRINKGYYLHGKECYNYPPISTVIVIGSNCHQSNLKNTWSLLIYIKNHL